MLTFAAGMLFAGIIIPIGYWVIIRGVEDIRKTL